MCVRRHVLAKQRERRVAVALRQVAQDLIVGAVLANDVEDVLDRRRVADLARNGVGDGRVRRRQGEPP